MPHTLHAYRIHYTVSTAVTVHECKELDMPS